MYRKRARGYWLTGNRLCAQWWWRCSGCIQGWRTSFLFSSRLIFTLEKGFKPYKVSYLYNYDSTRDGNQFRRARTVSIICLCSNWSPYHLPLCAKTVTSSSCGRQPATHRGWQRRNWGCDHGGGRRCQNTEKGKGKMTLTAGSIMIQQIWWLVQSSIFEPRDTRKDSQTTDLYVLGRSAISGFTLLAIFTETALVANFCSVLTWLKGSHMRMTGVKF